MGSRTRISIAVSIAGSVAVLAGNAAVESVASARATVPPESVAAAVKAQVRDIAALAATSSGATAVSQRTLVALAQGLDQPIYWVGPRIGDTYELTRLRGGDIYVRYLPAGVKVGTKAEYLTVGTYPVKNAFSIIRSLAHQARNVSVPVNGGTSFYGLRHPQSVFVAFPGEPFQIEVFDPTAGAALHLVRHDLLRAV